LEEFLYAYKGAFQDPKGIPPRRGVEHETHIFPNSPLFNIGMYKEFVLEANKVKK
jgi:hypothetical protein